MTRCFAFVDKLLQFHNDAVANKNISINRGRPGTYIKRTKSPDVYKVMDVITAGSDNGPAPVWLVDDDNPNAVTQFKYQGKPLLTRTADMFLDKPDGAPMGAFDNNYIVLRDVTDAVIDIYRRDIGTNSYTINHGEKLLPHHQEDLKRNEDFNMTDYIRRVAGISQEKNDPHTNGVLFEGQVVTAEWLGHYLYGMVRQESTLADETMDDMRDKLQWLSNYGKDGQSDSEAPQFQAAADEGSKMVQFLSHFSETSFSSPRDAQNGLVEFLKTQHRWKKISCQAPEKNGVVVNAVSRGLASPSDVYTPSIERDIYTIKCSLDGIEYTFGIGHIDGM